jgi:hypothetical protein
MASEWAFACHYPTERTRRSAAPGWLHTYNPPATLGDRQGPTAHPIDQRRWPVHLNRDVFGEFAASSERHKPH